jgi:glycosyltransferase involved in cell wall biosynthesis
MSDRRRNYPIFRQWDLCWQSCRFSAIKSSMKIWILKDSEQLPHSAGVKPMRVGMLSEILAQRGHKVRWYCSTFHHRAKTLYTTKDQRQILPSGVEVQMIHAGSYARNLSLARILHHRRLAKRWRNMVEASPEKPDVILVAYPIIEWVREALCYAKPRGIPVVVDVRDQWPDIFANYAPAPLKPFIRLGAALLYPYAGRVLREASYLTSMSGHVLRWALQKSGRKQGQDCRIFYLGTALSDGTLAPKHVSQVGEVIRVTFIGSLGHTADVLTIAQAAKLLATESSPIHITLAGDGMMMRQLRALQEIPEIFVLPGWLDTESARTLLLGSDIALLTGNAEAMPNKFFDYLAAQLPIVCSLRGECREYIETHGLGVTCASGDPAALASAIKTVAGNLPRYRAALAQVPPEHYSKKMIYTSFAEFLESVPTLTTSP